jgi:murein DD-endopeptidase MepM/ murein hydrolase activator NlpD
MEGKRNVMKNITFLVMIGFLMLSTIPLTMALPPSDVYLSTRIIHQGELSLIRIHSKSGETPLVTWMGKKVHLVPNPGKKDWIGFLGVDLTAGLGRKDVVVKISDSGPEQRLNMEIREKDYGVRNLTLPQNMVDLDAETLARVRKESAVTNALWEAEPSSPLWNGPFIKPIPGEVIGPFGRRSVINGQPRSPHTGVDLRGKKGTPIKAINTGRVVLTGDHFFSGLSVVIDHGGGIQSMYFHMDKIRVQQGEIVKKGVIIGSVGSTGRATGPHLHWGVRVNGARIDPLQLFDESSQLED